MNKVLIICSNFLPISSGGTIRCEKLIKYLPLYDWKSVVLTKKNSKTKSSFDIINDTNIYRSRKFDLTCYFFKIKVILSSFFFRTKKTNNTSITQTIEETTPVVKRRLSEYFLLPDADIFWALGAVLKARTVVRNENPKVILSTGPNHSVHIVGFFLKKFFGRYWVVEFRDPWTMNPFRIEKPYKFLTYLDNYLEKIVLKNADAINVTSIEYKTQFLEKYNFLDSDKIFNISNGFDPEDFNLDSNTTNEVLTIVHSGNFYSHRSSVQFIQAVLYLLKNNHLNENEFLIKFIGVLDEEGMKIIKNSKYKKCFLLLGSVNYQKSIKEIKSADILLLIPGPGIGTMPGKFYEYLAAEKPIFCISNEGPPKIYINEYGLGLVADDSNVKTIAFMFNKLIKNIQNNEFVYPNVSGLKEKFNRKIIAREMAKIFSKSFN